MHKLPVNHNKHKSLPFHDPSIDRQVIREFVRRFPRLHFHGFQRNSLDGPRPMHAIRFIGSRDDLIAAGLPVAGIDRALARGHASSDRPLDWSLTRDLRRKAGTLEAQYWVFNERRSADHPMAWLEPRHWRGGRCMRSALGEVRMLAPNVFRVFPDRAAVINHSVPVNCYPPNVVRIETARQRVDSRQIAGAA